MKVCGTYLGLSHLLKAYQWLYVKIVVPPDLVSSFTSSSPSSKLQQFNGKHTTSYQNQHTLSEIPKQISIMCFQKVYECKHCGGSTEDEIERCPTHSNHRALSLYEFRTPDCEKKDQPELLVYPVLCIPCYNEYLANPDIYPSIEDFLASPRRVAVEVTGKVSK